jgi:hypothetical protein
MDHILNIPLDMLKPIILEQEVVVLKQLAKDNDVSYPTFCVSVNKIMTRIYKMKTFEEMVYFVMEGNDMTQEEAKIYINGCLFEKTGMYN